MQPAHRTDRQDDWGGDWINRVVGSYRLLRVLGRGGMGVVFLAEHVRMGRRVAIKILHPALKSRPEVAQRLQAEARAMGRLSHPGVVAILDQDTLPDGTGFLVMEYLPGTSLRALLRKGEGSLPLDLSLHILWQAAHAMAAAHAAGVIHRDLSPANLFCVCPTDADVDKPSLAAPKATTADSNGADTNGPNSNAADVNAPDAITSASKAADGQSALPSSDLALLAENPAALTLKILDFGLARLVPPEGASSSSHNTTRDGAVMGTL